MSAVRWWLTAATLPLCIVLQILIVAWREAVVPIPRDLRDFWAERPWRSRHG